ncbi:MAG: PAS domain S-box protein [Phormidesmis sp.]
MSATSEGLSKLPIHLFEKAIAHCASGLVICDAQQLGMPIVYASPSFELLTGYKADDVIGKDFLFLQGEETEQIGLDDIRSAFAKGTSCKVLLRNYHKSGRPFWNEVTLSPIKDDADTITHYVGTQIDISHYLETFKALQESESRYRHLYEETPAMLHSVDADGGIVSVSHYWLEKLGYQRHEVIGQPIAKFLEQSPDEGVSQADHGATATANIAANDMSHDLPEPATHRDVPCQFLKKDGDRIDALISSIGECTTSAPQQPTAYRTLSVSVDITERKKVEENLRRNEALMRAINNLPPTGIFVMDSQTDEALFINTEFYKIWQLEPLQEAVLQGELSGEQLLSECLSNVDLSAFVATSTSEEFSGGTKIVEDEVPLLDGRTLRRIYGPIQENNVTFAYLYVFEDITPRKQAVRQLADATEAAEAANKAKSEFLANMSHELRSPLNAILGFTHILKDSNPNPEQRENLEIIYNSGNHLLALINDILDISKIEAGRVVVTESTFDLHQLLNELQQMFLNAAHSKGLRLMMEQSPTVPRVVCSDRLKLRQILINLLSNAIKFTDYGSVTISVTSQATDECAQKQTLSFAVSDTGSGIEPTDQERLFEAFVQTQSGLTAHEGTGLGLTISQEYVQLLGGKLEVTSVVDQGSTFSFDITATFVDAATQSNHSRRKVIGLAPKQPDYKVLVVDDVSVNRKLLTHLLSSVGFEVQEARNGEEAIAQWKAWRPQLIWMDMQMPVMTGEEAARQIRALDPQKSTKLIALTASAFEENKASALSNGCDDFLSKPVQAASVFRKMSQHLGVQYQYQDITPDPSERTHPRAMPLLSAAQLSQAPKDWQYQLSQATLDLDDAAIITLTKQLPPAQKNLAEAVRKCVETLSYKQLLQALQEAESQEPESRDESQEAEALNP